MTTPALDPFDALLDHLKHHRGFDFTGYKRSSLERRIRKRMDAVEVDGYADYLDVLEVQPEEFEELFDTILINVTGFFRDPEAWAHLRTDVVPALVAAHDPTAPIRVWVAGCASGQEAYTTAMVLAEVLGEPAFHERVKIYATDADEDALATARAAMYTPRQVEGVPPELLERFFERVDGQHCFRKDLRRAIIFGRNDLVQDAPISRIDLLTCRNTLMYFNAETQARILRRLHFALQDAGVLLLGKSEMLITHAELFRPVDLKRRIFAKVPTPARRERLVLGSSVEEREPASLRERAFDAWPGAQVVVDVDGRVALANAAASTLFAIGQPDVGRPLQDLELSYRPLELRSHLERAYAERRPQLVGGVTHRAGDGAELVLDVQITPLLDGDVVVGASVLYTDVTRAHALQHDLERAQAELESAYEELQSTVEELETTNEELQSTNEELETINDELRQRSLELDEVNAFLETILTSMGMGVVVLDREQRVRVWNAHAEDLWGARSEEVQGEHILALDIGLPLDTLRTEVRAALTGHDGRAEQVIEATNRRGRPIRCRVAVVPLVVGQAEPSGAIVLMEDLGASRGDGR